MEATQAGWLFPVAMTFVFVFLPVALWQAFHWMHALEDGHHEHDDHTGH